MVQEGVFVVWLHQFDSFFEVRVGVLAQAEVTLGVDFFFVRAFAEHLN